LPALLAKQAANIDHISGGRLTLNVVSSWWADEARKYGVSFESTTTLRTHRRMAGGAERSVVAGSFFLCGKYYRVEDNVFGAEAGVAPRPTLYAGGESPAAKELIAEKCDAYLMHAILRSACAKNADLRERRGKHNLPPLKFGVAGMQLCARPHAKHRTSCAGLRTCSNRPRVTRITSSGLRERNSSSASR